MSVMLQKICIIIFKGFVIFYIFMILFPLFMITENLLSNSLCPLVNIFFFVLRYLKLSSLPIFYFFIFLFFYYIYIYQSFYLKGGVALKSYNVELWRNDGAPPISPNCFLAGNGGSDCFTNFSSQFHIVPLWSDRHFKFQCCNSFLSWIPVVLVSKSVTTAPSL